MSPAPQPQRLTSDRLRGARALSDRFLAGGRRRADRDALVERFLPLARSLASRCASRGEPFEDVFQVACLGLLNAIDRYDPSRATAFSSFAVPTIVGEIKRHHRTRRRWPVHMPRDLEERTFAVARASEALERELERKPSVAEVADRMGLDDEAVLEALHARHARLARSLEALRSESEEDWDAVGTCDAGFEQAEHRATLGSLMVTLTSDERVLVELRFGHGLSHRQIGDQVGLSHMQTWRMLQHAIGKLRASAELEPPVSAAA